MRSKRSFILKKLNLGLPLIIVGLLILGSLGYWFLTNHQIKSLSASSYDQAVTIQKECTDLAYKERCYSKAFYDLTKSTDVSFARDTLKQLQQLDPKNSLGCHFIAHQIANAAVEKDPQNWNKLINQITPYECTGGYIHGMIEIHIREQGQNIKLTSDVMNQVCQKFNTGIILNEYAMRNCFHILGHISVAETAGDIDLSLKICDGFGSSYRRIECYGGVFMETMTRENLIAHGLSEPFVWDEENTKKTEEVCRKYPGEYGSACWKDISYMYVSVSKNDPFELYKRCHRAPTESDAKECFIFGSGNMVTFSSFDRSSLPQVCQPVVSDKDLYTRCLNNMMGALLTSSFDNISDVTQTCLDNLQKHPTCFDFMTTILKRNGADLQMMKNVCQKIPEESKPYYCTL